jgi:endoglucanase
MEGITAGTDNFFMRSSVTFLLWLCRPLPLLLVLLTPSVASDLVEVKPLTSRILMLLFDDGHVRHHRRGEPRSMEWAVVDPLDVARAGYNSTYRLQSDDDPNFGEARNPVRVGRKTKPVHFTMRCQSYNNGCFNTDPDHALRHWIYLELPFDLQRGSSYTLHLDGIAANRNSVTFTYDERQLHSEAIHVNNLGYSTAAPAKYAYIYHWAGDWGGLDFSSFEGKYFYLYDTAGGTNVYAGKIAFRKNALNPETGQEGDNPNRNFAGADVYECDFSDFNVAGIYKIVVDGMGSSFPFEIGENAYFEAFYWTMKGLYNNRSGIELNGEHAQFPRPAPHHPGLTPGFAGKLRYSSFRSFDLSSGDGGPDDRAPIEAQDKGALEDTWGWYQDAGDWDGYYTHTHIPAYLMFLYEAGPSKFYDGQLNIPESGNGIPDLLDEAAWLLRYFKRAKDEIRQKGWGSGGVPGARVFGDLWGSDEAPGGRGQGSWEDTVRHWYVLGEDVWTTYKYAALASQMAFILDREGKTDPMGVDWASEAILAYNWAESRSRPADEDQKLGFWLRDIRCYAASGLYRLTGESRYHNTAVREILANTMPLDPANPDAMFGFWTYLLASNRPRHLSAYAKVRGMIAQCAEIHLISPATARAARWGGNFNFPMLVGQPTTPMVTPGVYGYLIRRQAAPGADLDYLKYLHTTADYFLGCNPLNITWISGLGERYPTGIFHMDWWYADKDDPNNAVPVLKGVVPYGPWRVQDFGSMGWWNPNWAYSDAAGNPRIYPVDIHQWPGHERWFDQRVSPLSCEFTVHQNLVVSAFVYGFLVAGAPSSLEPGEMLITSAQDWRAEPGGQWLIYPNPAITLLGIRAPEGESILKVEILDFKGNYLFTHVPEIPQTVFEMEIERFARGNYQLVITTGNHEVLTRKVFFGP